MIQIKKYSVTQNIYTDITVLFDAGCSCSYNSVNEYEMSKEVCADILFVNGTEFTTSNYTVTVSTADTSSTIQSIYLLFCTWMSWMHVS